MTIKLIKTQTCAQILKALICANIHTYTATLTVTQIYFKVHFTKTHSTELIVAEIMINHQ